ncbi:MAG: hypothetical protein WD342_02005 [Verrucomicrobiales bacterium]
MSFSLQSMEFGVDGFARAKIEGPAESERGGVSELIREKLLGNRFFNPNAPSPRIAPGWRGFSRQLRSDGPSSIAVSRHLLSPSCQQVPPATSRVAPFFVTACPAKPFGMAGNSCQTDAAGACPAAAITAIAAKLRTIRRAFMMVQRAIELI